MTLKICDIHGINKTLYLNDSSVLEIRNCLGICIRGVGEARKGGLCGENGVFRRSVQGCVSLGRTRDRTFVQFCWFPAFSCWVPLAGTVPGLVHVLKAYGYTDLAGSQRKYCFLIQGVLCAVRMKFILMDGYPQAKSQLCVKGAHTEHKSLRQSAVGFTCTLVRWG